VNRGRQDGLRREELAFLSGVSMTWYTWLEQGRDINPSRQVLNALCAALHLSASESDYVLGLAGFTAEPEPAGLSVELPGHIQRFLDSMPDSPAFALTADWTIAGWNDAYARLYPHIAEVEPSSRNLLYLIYVDPSVRNLLPDWESTSALFLADFRASIGSRLDSGDYAALLRRLSSASEEFRNDWARHDIGRFSSRIRHFRHPSGETRSYEQHLFHPSDQQGIEVVVYRSLA
jgi:transcriptional regulator with XRE-family HTH domain